MISYLKIIKKYKLDNYLKILIEENSSNNLPYHNFYHILCVMYHAFLISKSLGHSNKETKNLLIAAIFHDFDHSGGKLKDSENVKNAIKAFLKYSEESKENTDAVVSIIEATEYPYVIEEKSLTEYQKVIRDADLMQTFKDNYLQQNWIGLASEMNAPLLKALEGSEKFWQSVKFHTQFAKDTAEKIMPGRYEDVKYLINLLNK